MKPLYFVFVFTACLAGSGCVSTPPLSEATGASESNIMIKDVVVRVKCELSEAFDKKTEDPKFLWLADWTVKADLTLSINDTAGITPSGSFTKFSRSTKNTDAGPTAPLVSQFFTFGAGATLNSQAVRTETVSFTVALDELKLWRERIEREESSPSFPPEKRTCRPKGIGVTGNLGLKEWVDSAFFPVEARELEAGIHPAPLSQKAGSVPSKAAGSQAGTKSALGAERALTYAIMQARLTRWKKDLQEKLDVVERAEADIKAAAQKITSSQSSLDTKISQMRLDAPKYRYVLASYLKKRLQLVADYRNVMWSYARNANQCTKRVSELAGAGSDGFIAKTIKRIDDLNTGIEQEFRKGSQPSDTPAVCSQIWIDYYNLADPSAIEGEAGDDTEAHKACKGKTKTGPSDLAQLPQSLLNNKDAEKCAVLIKANADDSVLVAGALPNQIDPPVDSILHSVNFVITYGATISPSWTLIQWKGPAQNGSLAGANGVQTNTLDLALGPRNGTTTASADAVRLITNQTVRALGQ